MAGGGLLSLHDLQEGKCKPVILTKPHSHNKYNIIMVTHCLTHGIQGLIFLTKSQLFSSLQELLQYYTFQANLPQMEHYLRQPYQPAECQIPDLARNYGMHTSSSSTASHHLLRSSGMPRLKNKSAPELLDDKCRFSGWIRKQGGGHKNCECLSVRVRAMVGSAVLVVEGHKNCEW